MTTSNERLEQARDAYRRRDWAIACALFDAAGRSGRLAARDLDARADSAWWLGRTDEALAGYEAAYRCYLDGEQPAQAAHVAMGIGFLSYLRGDGVGGSGWIGRARRLLRDLPECVEHGYLRSLEIDEALAAGDDDRAIRVARQVQDLADHCNDQTLHAVGLVGEGTALVKQGSVADGLAVIDEAMIAVRTDDVEPEWAGNLYCQVMALCHELADLRRARQWTDATERWCAQFTSAVMFAGICRVHRVQLLQVAGDWQRAEREAQRVCDELADMNVAVVAEGHYQVGEVRRLRGDADRAEAGYRRARELGRDPQPGLALLRLAQGRVRDASTSIRAALAAQTDRLARARLDIACVEIGLASGDLAAARHAATELDRIAAAYDSPGFAASARQAHGAIRLAEGRPAPAVSELRAACRAWQELDAPYQVAQVRVRLAEAYLALGDEDDAALELEAAAAAFDRLGVAVGARRLDELRQRRPLPDGLTRREVQVLALIAEGMTNRAAAAELVVSEKTVARHLANIYTKLGLSTRTAAAAYAFEHGLAAHRG